MRHLKTLALVAPLALFAIAMAEWRGLDEWIYYALAALLIAGAQMATVPNAPLLSVPFEPVPADHVAAFHDTSRAGRRSRRRPRPSRRTRPRASSWP